MVDKEPNPFDPAKNPAVEYVPYDEDPALLEAAKPDTETGRELRRRINSWQSAVHELGYTPDNLAMQASKQYAEENLESYLTELSIPRSVRERSQDAEE